jgi:hypothetical protein
MTTAQLQAAWAARPGADRKSRSRFLTQICSRAASSSLGQLRAIQATERSGGKRGARKGARGAERGNHLLGVPDQLNNQLAAAPLLSCAYVVTAFELQPALHGLDARADVELFVDVLQVPLDCLRRQA